MEPYREGCIYFFASVLTYPTVKMTDGNSCNLELGVHKILWIYFVVVHVDEVRQYLWTALIQGHFFPSMIYECETPVVWYWHGKPKNSDEICYSDTLYTIKLECTDMVQTQTSELRGRRLASCALTRHTGFILMLTVYFTSGCTVQAGKYNI